MSSSNIKLLYCSLFFTLGFLSPPSTANAHSCSDGFKSATSKIKITQHCRKKVDLGAEFAWNFDNKSRKLEIAFGARLGDGDSAGWIAWGLNPDGPHMVGTRAMIGIKQANGSVECHNYDVGVGARIGCPLLPWSAEEEEGGGGGGGDELGFFFNEIGYHVIVASVGFLPHVYNTSRINVVWQIGAAAAGKQPLMHPKTLANFDCAETVDLVSDRIIHGILNIVGWGTLLPVGVIIARYFRRFPKEWKWWFTFHVSCQTIGYILGLSGWALGIWLGNTSKYYSFTCHRSLGIIIFTFTTIQMVALRLKPKSGDEYRSYWNMYHHFLGYALLALISVNIFVGISIIGAGRAWKWAYIGILGCLGAVALAFEVLTWIKFVLSILDNKQTELSPHPYYIHVIRVRTIPFFRSR
ncbi:hypothetical protein MIMGU_mgv1a026502mg [Erythranthe guttata]|uniref:Cytochrome b561 and DOMON domain-containing protein n=1 Tax=Erythranthe guttata TaxID=4155 RepID=A0A022QYG7_ERYGU|nr:hypothetical protein MIMGU_mgv1a026502mg [Erythranthe guttata]